MADDLTLDLEELRNFGAVSKRPQSSPSFPPRSIDWISFRKNPLLHPLLAPAPIATAKVVPTSPSVTYATLGSFSWDQDNDKVKIYISLEGVNREKIETDFKPMAVDIKIHDVNGKNYWCAIPKLNKEIVPEKCKVLVKPSRIIVTLVKASKGNWLDLHLKENKLKPGLDKEKDSMAGIMDLMKVEDEEDVNTQFHADSSMPTSSTYRSPGSSGSHKWRRIAHVESMMHGMMEAFKSSISDFSASIRDNKNTPEQSHAMVAALEALDLDETYFMECYKLLMSNYQLHLTFRYCPPEMRRKILDKIVEDARRSK